MLMNQFNVVYKFELGATINIVLPSVVYAKDFEEAKTKVEDFLKSTRLSNKASISGLNQTGLTWLV